MKISKAAVWNIAIIASTGACSRVDQVAKLPPEDLWIGPEVRPLTEEERGRLEVFLRDELLWAEGLAQSGRTAGRVDSAGQLARIEATTRGLYVLVAEAKLNSIKSGGVKVASNLVPRLLETQYSRISNGIALVLGQYPGIGTVVFKVEREDEPLAHDAVVLALREAAECEAAREFSLLQNSGKR